MWLNERTDDWLEKPLHDAKVLVWCAIFCRKINGPYFFEETVNKHTYLDMLKIFFKPKHYRVESHKNYYIIRLIRFKSGFKVNWGEIHDQETMASTTSIHVIISYGAILSLKYISHCRKIWMILKRTSQY